MKSVSTLLFLLKSLFWGLLIGFCFLFFMPNSKLAFNWQSAKDMYAFYQSHKQEAPSEKSLQSLTVENLSLASAVKKASPSVVSLTVFRPSLRADERLAPNQRIVDLSIGVGSGVIVSNEGYIVTNYHVIEKAERISVNLPDGRKRFVEVIGYDQKTDLAVLKTDLQGLSSAELAMTSVAEPGDLVMAIGSPFGAAQSVTLGIVSAITFELPTNRIQTDAAINSGNSGGALINTKGEVVGINQMILSSRGGGQTGVNYAIPIDFVRNIVDDIIAYGLVRRNWFGITGVELPLDSHRELFPSVESGLGVGVGKIEANSPAEKAGIKERDLMTHFDGKRIDGMKSFHEIFYNTPLGKKVEVKLIRQGKTILTQVQLISNQTEPL